MDNKAQPMNRRTVLQRGVAFLAGITGLDIIERTSRAQAEPLEGLGSEPPAGTREMRLFASHWQTRTPGQTPGKLCAPNGRLERAGDLFDATTGKKAGEFYATCLALQSSFGVPAKGGVELHTLKFGAETLFGMASTGTGSIGPQLHAIVGGTGRFAGARGSYVVSQPAGKLGTAEIIITIIS